MNKKGFTIVELLAVIIIIGVLSTVAVFSYDRVIEKSRKDALKDNENSLRAGAEDLLTHCASTITNPAYCVSVPAFDETVRITIDNLVAGNFLNKIVDPSNVSNYCDGYVDVTNISSGKTTLEYKVCLKCGHYKSSDCQ